MFKEFILKNIVFKKRLELLEKKKKLYKEIIKEEDIYNYQLHKFNNTWNYCINNLPFYKMWKQKHNLPEKISSISDLKEFPILTKKDIHENKDLILENLENYDLISTGGTSGITTEFPTSKHDRDITYINAYLCRSWWGIKPMDNILMFWGHSHLFGKGLKGYINHIKRRFSDFLINTTRISSYSLTNENVKDFYEEIIEVKPESIISYSSNIFKICKHMESNNLYYKDNNLKGIILTSETVTNVDINLINKYLNTNVINEYGMAETGVISYSYEATNNIKTLWDSFILTSNDDELIITTINDSIFPLINYTSEDVLVVKEIYKESILSISSIEGKVRNVLNISFLDGTSQEISTIFFDHVLKNYPNIYSIHYKQDDINVIIYLTSNISLDLLNLNDFLRNEVKKEFLNIDFLKITMVQVDNVDKTIAGKNKTLL
jgi:phenylacetate-CoA ligase